jgi:RNA polymerase sigma factor (TIGR02999 family)
MQASIAPIPPDVTGWLIDWSGGDSKALDELLPLVYAELRRIASRHLRGESPGHSLQPTDVVHEAFLRLVRQKVTWQNRAHFFGVAAEAMRRLLVDHARKKHAEKRGAGAETISIDSSVEWLDEREINLIALDDCLTALSAIDAQQSKVIELRFFAGLSVEETAEVLNVSGTTVKREWRMARAWLLREMSSSHSHTHGGK